MSRSRTITRALVISAGTNAENQCIGVLRAVGLGSSFATCQAVHPPNALQDLLRVLPANSSIASLVRASWLASLLSRILRSKEVEGVLSVRQADASKIVEQAREQLATKGPLLVVAAGHDAVETAVQIHRIGNDCTFVVQLQHPCQDMTLFDFVITPYHDVFDTDGTLRFHWPPLSAYPWAPAERPGPYAPAPRSHAPPLLLTQGALHRVDELALADAAATWSDWFSAVPRPFIFVCVGGPTRHCPYVAEEMAEELAEGVSGMAALSGGSIYVTGSRRTPPLMLSSLSRRLARHPRAALWDGQGPNPYLGALAWCDAVVVTADSVSMASEACSTGKPVYVAGERFCRPPWCRVPVPLPVSMSVPALMPIREQLSCPSDLFGRLVDTCVVNTCKVQSSPVPSGSERSSMPHVEFHTNSAASSRSRSRSRSWSRNSTTGRYPQDCVAGSSVSVGPPQVGTPSRGTWWGIGQRQAASPGGRPYAISPAFPLRPAANVRIPLVRGSKLHAFHARLRARGATRPLSPSADARDWWSYPPLNDVALAAEALRFAVMGKNWIIDRAAATSESST